MALPADDRSAKPKRFRPVLLFWAAFAALVMVGVAVLQLLGPPAKPKAIVQPQAAAPKPPAQAAKPPGPGSAIAPPDPALLAPAASNPGLMLPRIGPGGAMPMRVYAAPGGMSGGPHVGIVLAGIGDDADQSRRAITTLPAAVSLAMTPYGQHIAEMAALARAGGHELLLAIPMQEIDPASQNAGNEALMLADPVTRNQPMLDWNLARLQGYAGVTDAIGASQGAGFMSNPAARAWLLQEIADRGLFFIDARQHGPLPFAWSRTADIVIDPVGAPQSEAAQLERLAADAKQQGSALGVLLYPAPLAVQDLAAWAQSLPGQGIALVPASTLVLSPTQQPAMPAATP